MRQRLALERALLHGPRLVLLDEPFTGLDDRAVSVVADRLRRLARRRRDRVLATHDLDLADGLVTRVAIVARRTAGRGRAGGARACARATARWSEARLTMFFRIALLVLRKDFAIEAKSCEILYDDAVLRRRRAC